jgi:hypothetical protein
MRYEPRHPSANKDGYVYMSNVNSIEEMTNMISANRSFATNIDAINTARDLLAQNHLDGPLDLEEIMIMISYHADQRNRRHQRHRHDGHRHRRPREPAPPAVPLRAQLRGHRRQRRHHARRHGFLTLMLAQLQEPGSDQPGRQQ